MVVQTEDNLITRILEDRKVTLGLTFYLTWTKTIQRILKIVGFGFSKIESEAEKNWSKRHTTSKISVRMIVKETQTILGHIH